MENLLFNSIFDKWGSQTCTGADRISEKRSLHLTIDGVHINSAGAEIYRKVISEAIEKLL